MHVKLSEQLFTRDQLFEVNDVIFPTKNNSVFDDLVGIYLSS